MRIVDADRLKRSFEANTPIAFQDCVPGIHAIIDLEPTVEAIPVEWLENFRDGLDTLSESQLMRAIDLIIDAYRVEKKRKEE